ncbi:MAG: cell division protein SepF [Actinomycetota bacterium]
MSMWKKAMDYLGLGPDDAYDDYDMAPEPERPMRANRAPMRDDMGRQQRGGQQGGYQQMGYQQGGYQQEYEPELPPVRTVASRPSFPSSQPDVAIRRPVPASDDSSVQPRPINPRPAPSVARVAPPPSGTDPYTVKPRRFDSAQEVADKFKDGLPVIMNLEAADREVARRLIDFASGLCYGLNGSMEKVATGVYLLKPLPRHSGYDDQGYGA